MEARRDALTDPRPLDVKRPADLPPVVLKPIRPENVSVEKPPAPDVSVPLWQTVLLYIRRRIERMTGDLDRGLDPGPILSIGKIDRFLNVTLPILFVLVLACLILALILYRC